LVINKERMREQGWVNWATATDLASALVRKNDWPWRTAHQVVGILVRLSEERGLGPADATPELLDEASELYHEIPAGLDQAEIKAALDPGRFIAARTLKGGPAPAESMRQADLFERGLAADEGIVRGIDERLAAAAQKLETAVDALAAKAQ